jgi:hypothetical protein
MANDKKTLVIKENYSWYNGNINVTGRSFDLNMQGVAYGNGYFIAVGKEARVYRSRDGITWTNISPSKFGSSRHFFGIDYDPGHNVWIIAARDGYIIKSDNDGDSWELVYSTGSSDDLLYVVSGNSVVLVISEGGKVFRSTDGGDEWDKYTWDPIAQRPRSVTFAKGVFAAGGYNGAVFYSPNGKEDNWTQVNSGSNMRIRGLAYSPGLDLWVAGGMEVCTSKDLKKWNFRFNISQKFNLPDQVYSGCGGNSFALLAGEHGMMLSTTDPSGQTWATRESGVGGYILDMANNTDNTLVVNVGNTVCNRTPDYLWHYPFRYNSDKGVNPNTPPLYVMRGSEVVNQIDARYIPLAGSANLRPEVHLRKDSRGYLWASIHDFGLYYSTNGGITWSFKANDLVTHDTTAYSYFTILNDDTFLLGKVIDGWTKNKERTPILFYRSRDYGDSWQPVGQIKAAPFEAISEGTQNLTQLADGTILYAATRYNWEPDPEEPDAIRENAIYRSTDGGFTWGDKSVTYSAGSDKYVFEPHIIQLQSGKLLGAFRYQRHKLPGDTQAAVTAAGGSWSCCTSGRNKSIFNQVYIGESYDNGYTWVNLHDIRDSKGNLLLSWGEPHGTLLQLPDGRVLLVYDHRYESGPNCTQENSWQVCNRAVVSSDEGATWGPEIYHLSYGKGYPSSVFLDDGTIVTVTGNDLENQKPFTAMVVRWKLPEAAPKKSITLTSPNGGENWKINSAYNITWSSTGSVGTVAVEYSIDNGKSWNKILSPVKNDGMHRWKIAGSSSANCLVRIRELDSGIFDVSDAVFSIASPPPPASLTITSPNGGESWEPGTSHDITWASTGTIGNVAIDYSITNGSSWLEITPSAPNNGTFTWRVPDTPSKECIVKIRGTGNEAEDKSDAAFSIELPSIFIKLTSPIGKEVWESDTVKAITWAARGISGDVLITLWKDGNRIGTIAENVPASPGSYNWTVGRHSNGTAASGNGYSIKVKGMKKGERVSGDSDGEFTIGEPPVSVTITSPNGGESWKIGNVKKITWNARGITGKVIITLWKDGERIGTIAGRVPSTPGSFDWTVGRLRGGSAVAGTGYTVRVKGKKRGERTYDDSNAPFEIRD